MPIEMAMDPAGYERRNQMKISVAYNWDLSLLEQLARLGVHEIFAAPDRSLLGSGRTTSNARDMRHEEVETHVRRAQEHGLRFNYLINSTHLDTSVGEAAIVAYLESVQDLRPDLLTVAHPRLIEMAARHIDVPLKVSINAHLKDPTAINSYPFSLATRVNLDTTVNREFEALSVLRRDVAIELELLANQGCLPDCALREEHNRLCSISSSCGATREVEKQELKLLAGCFTSRLNDPVHLISAHWIRPEDVEVYERMGYDYIKVAGRRKPSDWILNAATAYARRRYSGNLLDIMCLSREELVFGRPAGNGFIVDNDILTHENFLHRVRKAESRKQTYAELAHKAVRIVDPEAKRRTLRAVGCDPERPLEG